LEAVVNENDTREISLKDTKIFDQEPIQQTAVRAPENPFRREAWQNHLHDRESISQFRGCENKHIKLGKGSCDELVDAATLFDVHCQRALPVTDLRFEVV
jgi:predicted N-acyltransferase